MEVHFTYCCIMSHFSSNKPNNYINCNSIVFVLSIHNLLPFLNPRLRHHECTGALLLETFLCADNWPTGESPFDRAPSPFHLLLYMIIEQVDDRMKMKNFVILVSESDEIYYSQ